MEFVTRSGKLCKLTTAFCTNQIRNGDKGSVISYQQRLTEKYVINNYAQTPFPKLPLPDAGERFKNNVSICLNSNKLAKLESLSVTLEMVHALEEKTREQDESDLWHSLRKKNESLQASLE